MLKVILIGVVLVSSFFLKLVSSESFDKNIQLNTNFENLTNNNGFGSEIVETDDLIYNKNVSSSEYEYEEKIDENNGESGAIKSLKFAEQTLAEILNLGPMTKNRSNVPFFSPPQFMLDLYKEVTDSSGSLISQFPYSSHYVTSYAETSSNSTDYFSFDIANLDSNLTQIILEIEFIVHRQRTSYQDLHPSLHLTPFCILSLYQVVDKNYLNVPDLHRLIGVHYVPALGSGWEIFNVKQAVLEWIKGVRPNYGFLLVATSLGGDRVPVKFSRRQETDPKNQPILVVFNDDGKNKKTFEKIQRSNQNESDAMKDEDLNNTTKSENNENNFIVSEETIAQNTNLNLHNPRFHHALLFKDSFRHPNSINFRNRRSKNSTDKNDAKGCSKKDLILNFEPMYWSPSLILPKSLNIFKCSGSCDFPISLQIRSTNHAVVESIAKELNLNNGANGGCCVPNSLLPISVLLYESPNTVVLKKVNHLIVDSCSCQ